MALVGAEAVMRLIDQHLGPATITYVSDSQYLVKGMTEWIHGWKAKGWRRKTGTIENLELWKSLDLAARKHEVTFQWVRGHAGNPKNEYADRVAVRAAEEQTSTDGLVASGWDDWFARQRERGSFRDFNADDHFIGVTTAADRR